MGVIKNEVGRPTNKSIMIRRILKLILLLVIVAGVFCAGYYYKDKEDTNKKEDNKVKEEESKQEFDKSEAKKILDRYVLLSYGDFTEYNFSDDYKTILAIKKTKPVKKNYSCTSMFGENITSAEDSFGKGSYTVSDLLCTDGEQDFYSYSDVEKEYKKLFGTSSKPSNKEIISTDFSTNYGYSKLKDGYVFLSCECGDGAPYVKDYIYDSYVKNNELHIIFSTFYYEKNIDTDKIEVWAPSGKEERINISASNDFSLDNEGNLVGDVEKVFKENKFKLPTYDFVLEKTSDGYIYNSLNELNK